MLYIFAWVVSVVNYPKRHQKYCTKQTKRCSEDLGSPNYRYELLGKDTPICCATHLYMILKDVVKVLEEHQIEYFISFGTLLGAVRHGGMIPWDTDIDIVVSEEGQAKAYALLQQFYSHQYDISIDKYKGMVGDIVRINYSKVNHLHIDIFIYQQPDNHTVYLGLQETLAYDVIFPLKPITFYDLSLYAPNDSDTFLKHFFGEDYRTHAYRQWGLDKRKFKLQSFEPAPIDVKMYDS